VGRGPPGSSDRFATYAGVLSLLSAAAESGPQLLVVDDAQWLDEASAEALVFAARRLGEEGIGMVFAAREGERTRFEATGLPEMPLSGLDVEAAAALLEERGGHAVSHDVARRLCEATAGNPLALGELAEVLSAAQLDGSEPFVEPLPTGTDVERAFGRRIDGLPGETRRALVLAATDATTSFHALFRALRSQGLEEGALEPAEAEGLITISAHRVHFRHPLVRAVAYRRASGPEQRAAHRALAGALKGDDDDGRRARHLAAATLQPDEAVASQLEGVGREALGRGAPEAAGRALEAAARVTPDPPARMRRTLEAAAFFGIATNREAAQPLLDAALAASAGDPLVRADVQQLRARVDIMAGRIHALYEMLLAEVDLVLPHDRTRAASLLSDASALAVMDGASRAALESAERAFAVGGALAGPGEALAHYTLGTGLVLVGRTAEARPHLERTQRFFESQPGPVLMPATLAIELQCFDEIERSRDTLVELFARAQEMGDASYAHTLAGLAWAEFRLGDWPSAYAAATRSVALAEDTGQRAELSFSLVRLAEIEAGRGLETDSRAHAGLAVEIAGELGVGSIPQMAEATLGLLDLGVGRLEAAVEQLEPLGRRCLRGGLEDPVTVPWAQDLCEAAIRLRRPAEAEWALSTLERQAAQTGQRIAAAAAARCRAMLSDDHDVAADLFERALALHTQRPAPFDRARTELCFGERLRRARRRTEARQHLRRALEAFEALGARPWSEKASRELAATGERARRRDAETRDDLTAQELQVALVVAEGATNREAAAQLFISAKTVEAHLSRVYRKLGLRSRTELARRFSASGSRPAAEEPA
jgi:DNA-binding CsgD family transcriptional regulator